MGQTSVGNPIPVCKGLLVGTLPFPGPALSSSLYQTCQPLVQVPVLPRVEAQAAQWTTPGSLMLVEMVCVLGLSYPTEGSEQERGHFPQISSHRASSWETKETL